MILALSKVKEDKIEKTITLKGGKGCIDRVLALLALLEYNGNIGTSSNVAISWDGDGTDSIAVKGNEDVKKGLTPYFQAAVDHGADCIMINGETQPILYTARVETKDRV